MLAKEVSVCPQQTSETERIGLSQMCSPEKSLLTVLQSSSPDPLLFLLSLYFQVHICLWKCVSRSVVSDSLQPHGLWPARLFCPWNSPDKSAGVGSQSLLQGIFLTWVCHMVGRFFFIWIIRKAPLSILVAQQDHYKDFTQNQNIFLLQRRHKDGQKAHDKMLSIINYQRIANQNYNEVSPHTDQCGRHRQVYEQRLGTSLVVQ